MVENLIVGVLVGGALVLAGRSLYRTLAGKNDGCGCGNSCLRSGTCHPSADDGARAHTLVQIRPVPQDERGDA